MKDKDKGKGTFTLIVFLCSLYAEYSYHDIKIANEKYQALETIKHKAVKKKIKEKLIYYKDYGKLKTHFTTMNGWVSDCWTCSKLKKENKKLTTFVLELGKRN